MLLLNNQPINFFQFSGGELQVNVGYFLSERCTLTWKPTTPDDIMQLLLTVNALQHAGCRDIIVDCLYLPYARQDRVCAPGEACSLEVMVKLLDDINVADIRFWDLHNSDLTLNMFQDTCVHETEIHDIFSYYKVLNDFDLDNLILCAPDIGARMKVDDIVKEFELGNAIHFEKNRNPETGAILGIEQCKYNRNFDGYNLLVVDDICDGGRTFIEVAKKLREHTAENLYLYVTHGIFSKGLSELLQYYKHIFCHHVLHDSLYKSDENITILREFTHVS
jgi:ribose-phosphate pyrophosphokinase